MSNTLPQETDKIKTIIIGMFDREISTALTRLVVDVVVNSCLKFNPEMKFKQGEFLHCRASLGSEIPGDTSKTSKPSNDLEEFLLYNAKRITQDFDFPISIDKASLIKALAKSKQRLEKTYDCVINVFQHTEKNTPQIVVELHSSALKRPFSLKVNV